jgi:hypothetical protein
MIAGALGMKCAVGRNFLGLFSLKSIDAPLVKLFDKFGTAAQSHQL